MLGILKAKRKDNKEGRVREGAVRKEKKYWTGRKGVHGRILFFGVKEKLKPINIFFSIERKRINRTSNFERLLNIKNGSKREIEETISFYCFGKIKMNRSR